GGKPGFARFEAHGRTQTPRAREPVRIRRPGAGPINEGRARRRPVLPRSEATVGWETRDGFPETAPPSTRRLWPAAESGSSVPQAADPAPEHRMSYVADAWVLPAGDPQQPGRGRLIRK